MPRMFGSIIALLIGTGFLLAGQGLQITIVPIRASVEGFTPLQIGLVGSFYYLGFVAGCLGAPYVLLRSGHIRGFSAMVALTAATAIAHALWVDFWPWLVFRTLSGACLAGLYLTIESWLNERATNETRGMIMSSYIVVNFVTLTIGQLIVTLYAPQDFALFAIASMLMSLAVIPVSLTRSAQPAPIALVRFRPRAIFRSAPVGIVGAAVIGLANGAFWSLGPTYAIGKGLSTSEAAVFMSAAVIGGAIVQWPIGRLSDRVDRRMVLLVLLVLAALVGLVLGLAPIRGEAVLVLAFILGTVMLPGYSIAAAHAYDRTEAGNHVETSAGILLANGMCAAVGPVLASGAIALTSTSALFVYMAITQLGLAVYVYRRLGLRAPMAAEDKTGFDLAATAPVGTVIVPEPLDLRDPNVAVPEADKDEDPPPAR